MRLVKMFSLLSWVLIPDPEEGSTISEPPEKISTTEHDEKLSSTETSEPGYIAEDTDESGLNPITTEASGETHVNILIYCTVLLFIILLLAAVVLVVMSSKKRAGVCLLRKKETNMSFMASRDNTEDAHIEDTNPDHPPDVEGTGLYRVVEVHPKHTYDEIHFQEKPMDNGDEDPYITLTLSDLQEQTIYDNVGFPSQASVHLLSQEGLYAKVNKKPGQKGSVTNSTKVQT
nr:uncharacterized protein LOC132768652 isoform X2 [Anolis sagrei ordinatus]